MINTIYIKQFSFKILFFLIIMIVNNSCSNEQISSSFSPNGTYSISQNGNTIKVIVNGGSWTRISRTKTESGKVTGNNLYDNYGVNKYGVINLSEQSLTFKGLKLKK